VKVKNSNRISKKFWGWEGQIISGRKGMWYVSFPTEFDDEIGVFASEYDLIFEQHGELIP
jgi:hypothetical protein